VVDGQAVVGGVSDTVYHKIDDFISDISENSNLLYIQKGVNPWIMGPDGVV
jgi:hypothetical protein